MDMLANLALGFSVALSPENLLYCLLGALAGTLIGVLPGIGPTATLAMLLPVTFFLTPHSALIMLAGIYYGAQYGGSTTAILVNMPGEASSVVTCVDGHQMARKGRAGSALAIAALGSFFAGCVGTLVVAFVSGPLVKVALMFGPAEYFSLMLLGLLVAVALAHGSVLKSLAMIPIGLLLGGVGSDIETGAMRLTFGVPEFADGLSFIALAVGLFAVPEILINLESPHRRGDASAPIKKLWPTRDEARLAWPAALRGTALGSFLGTLPGAGAILASYAAYALEKRISKSPERFGHGAPEGLAAPEAANNAAAQTSFISLLTLGIPGSAIMAIMAGVLTMNGIIPGPQVMSRYPDLFWGLIASMFLGNLILVLLNLPLIRVWVMLLRVPYRLMYPSILFLCCIGVFAAENSIVDLYQLIAFSILGYALKKWHCEPAPLLLAFVLGPLLEDNMRRALQISGGDLTTFVSRPISLALLMLAVVAVTLVAVPAIRAQRRQTFVEEE